MRTQRVHFTGEGLFPPSDILIVGIWDEAPPHVVEAWARLVLPLGAHTVLVGNRVDWEEIMRVGRERGIIAEAPPEEKAP